MSGRVLLDRRRLLRTLLATILLAFSLAPGAPTSVDSFAQDASPWDALRAGGKVAVIRHALAPGTGDPPNFVIGDCATQRNLSDEGRAQARRIGEPFRENGVAVDRVLSSGWCRCIETSALAFGAGEVWPPLNSFFRDGSTEQAQTRETRAHIAAWDGPGTLVMVTHQVNITALTGIVPDSGEVIVLIPAPNEESGFVIAGRIAIN